MSSNKDLNDNIFKNKKNVSSKDILYEKSAEYWEQRESTVSDMLGGNPEVNDIDIKISKELIEDLNRNKLLKLNSVLDVGAGIGRVTSNVLQYYFNSIDLVERNKKFCDTAIRIFKNNQNVRKIYCSSLQKFKFERKYDCIWIQWCLENLEDDDLNLFIKLCRENLKDDGILIVKENIEEDQDFSYFDSDFSKVRSDKIFRNFFVRNNLQIIKHFHHPFWPKDLLNVSIFVLSKNKLI